MWSVSNTIVDDSTPEALALGLVRRTDYRMWRESITIVNDSTREGLVFLLDGLLNG